LIATTTVAANFAPPVIRSIKASYQFREELFPQSLVAYNDFNYQSLQPSELNAALPFQAVTAEDLNPALYFGFEPPVAKTRTSSTPAAASTPGLPSLSMSIYLDVEQASQGISTADPDSPSQSVVWEYWSGLAWTRLTVRDDTEGFRHPGLIRFLVPADFAASSRFGCIRYWLRAVPASTAYQPRVSIALLNTTMATGATTIKNELLGVSNGTPDQSFRLLHTPVLQGQLLEVLEPRMPGRSERQAIRRTEGDEAIPTAAAAAVDGSVWIPWLEVADFYASGPRDRHYLLDPLTGIVTFGDSATGQAPPRGGKIRASRYHAGGGAVGNRPAWNINQLKTAIPSVNAVCNWIPAGAGGDAEDDEALLERGSRGIRHGGRAVTVQDYEDLARLASPQVARARCVPLCDLAADPSGKQRQPGVVSVILVPQSDDRQPTPGAQLLESVLSYLRRRSSPAARISVVPCDFIRIDVEADIVLNEPDRAPQIELAVKNTLASFLHPLRGGANGSGWGFGRMPHKSDLFRLIEGIRGIEYVRDVRIFSMAQREDVEQSNHFLVSPGDFTVQCTLLSTVPGGGA
jgi:predicted phage baseplate assembly protein